MGTYRKAGICILYFMILLNSTIGCKSEHPQRAANFGSEQPLPTVVVQRMETRDEALTCSYSGRAAGSKEVSVYARASGILLERFYIEGAFINKGDLLVQLDAEPYKASFDKAAAVFRKAEKDWKRALELHSENAISGQERDDALFAYEQAKSDLWNAQINCDYTTITAPISGITGLESCSEGSLIEAGTDRGLITTITQIDPINVQFAYSDSEWLKWRQDALKGNVILPERLTVTIELPDGSMYDQEGCVDFTDSSLDLSTGTLNARAVFDNPKAVLLPGQFVRLTLHGIVKPKAFTLPENAIMYSTKGPFVYALTAEDKVEVRSVVLGSLTTKGRIIDAGLNINDRVITQGMIKVRPGQGVKVENAAQIASVASHCCQSCSCKNIK
ncbi:MAG: family efflux transporter subunit [Chlamydiales bacterium]|jgi:membrane fusion protein (multidrug efflux system)|nr:family efflux transporter subunit [Chlamydiales bacterium]